MKKISILLTIAVYAACMYSCNNSKNADSGQIAGQTPDSAQKRIVSLNGAITEIVSALGHEQELVGRDVTSTYPEWVKDSVKNLGHVRSLTIESIVALKPTLILASDKDISPDLEQKIKASGIKFKLFRQEFSIGGTKSLIREVAAFIGNNKDQALLDKIDADLAKVKPLPKKPKVLFIYARGAGTLMVAGQNTPMESIIKIAGGENAISNMNDFKPLTPEALLNSNPDIILLFDSGLKSLGGISGLLKIPGVDQTTAGKNRAVITMEGSLLSGFGPRVGEAALELNKLMTPYAQ